MKAACGHVFKYGDNVDTDVIIPARYLNSSDPKELATHCMEDIDKDFVKNVKEGDIIVANKNFGCGSSREHAPISIKAAGVSCVIAETFARIFYRNAINIGLPIIECPDAAKEIEAGDEVEIDFDSGMIYNRTKGTEFKGQAFPEFVDDPSHYEDGLYTHVIKPFKIPWHWTRVVSFDHGYTRPFSFGVWAVDEEGRVYRYKELYGCVPGEANVGVTCPPGEIARQLADLMEPEFEEGIHVCGIADPAIWDRSRGLSVEEQIRKVFNGVIFMKGDNTRLPGKMQLHERLKFDEEGRPMLYVFENCRDFRRTIPALVYDARRPEDIDTAGEDHIYDETRYFLMSRPIAPRPRKGFDE